MASDQIIHLYSLCWNEERMLPHLFRHYDDLVDQYFIFDNGSTDATLQMLAAHGRVQIAPFAIEDDSFVETERRLSDIIWHGSRGIANWVIIIDVDEHLYHPDLRGYLRSCTARGITAVTAVGYEMVSTIFPSTEAKLCDTVRCGVPSHYSNKLCIFDPAAITETNFSYGRHSADPTGRVVWQKQQVLLLHYKSLGLEYLTLRTAELGRKLPDRDANRGFGVRYRSAAEKTASEFHHLMALAVPLPELSASPGDEASTSPVFVELFRLNHHLAARNADVWQLKRTLSRDDAAVESRGRKESAQMLSSSNLVNLALTAAERRAVAAIEESNLFNRAYYLGRYPDVAESGCDPIVHYVRWGAAEDRDPSASFQTALYKAKLGAELTSLGLNPLLHAIHYGGLSAEMQESAAEPAERRASESAGKSLAIDGRSERHFIRQKADLELAMQEHPSDWDLRRNYFQCLHDLSRTHFGWFWAVLPDVRSPLFFRGGSSDLLNLRHIFLGSRQDGQAYIYGSYGFDMPRPRRILDLGGYCGYAAVYLANRFPDAKIISVEPPGPNLEVLRANTALYSNIRSVAAGAWYERTQLRLSGNVYGDWGMYFTPAGDGSPADVVPAYTIQDLLEMHGWDRADLIKCIIEGAQVDVLAAADRPWLDKVTTVITRPVAGQWRPGDEERLFTAFPADEFERVTREDVIAFRRPFTPSEAAAGPDPVPLIPPSPELRAFELRNIPRVLNFYRFGDNGLSLTPNPPCDAPAGVALVLPLRGHSVFNAHLVAGPADSGTIRFSLRIEDSSRTAILQDSKELRVGSADDWRVMLPPLDGTYEVLLSTEHVTERSGEPSWARIIDGRFL